MKLSLTTTTLALALAGTSFATPTATTNSNALSERDLNRLNLALADLDHFQAKRELMSQEEFEKREYATVTSILAAISQTGVAPALIIKIVADPTLSKITTNVIVEVLKSGLINLDTLLKALVDSGLINSVIEGLISDCDFYTQIYKLALSYIDDLVTKIESKLSKRDTIINYSDRYYNEVFARDTTSAAAPSATSTSTIDGIVDNLVDSLKNSGLATSTVKALITDKSFLSYGASLISAIIKSGALSLSDVISAILSSGLIPSLFKEFFNFDTLKTVAVNAFAAAFGKCDGSSVTLAVGPATTTITQQSTLTFVTPTNTAITITTTGSTSNCRRRKRRSYNY